CPWHLWEFDITTGHCLVDPKMRVKTYPVTIEEGMVVVYADPADLPPPSPAPMRAIEASGLQRETTKEDG
ncbi:MAG: Rieske (2Fe-2S) protein, partial [Thermomicrobiales bacterium]